MEKVNYAVLSEAQKALKRLDQMFSPLREASKMITGITEAARVIEDMYTARLVAEGELLIVRSELEGVPAEIEVKRTEMLADVEACREQEMRPLLESLQRLQDEEKEYKASVRALQRSLAFLNEAYDNLQTKHAAEEERHHVCIQGLELRQEDLKKALRSFLED